MLNKLKDNIHLIVTGIGVLLLWNLLFAPLGQWFSSNYKIEFPVKKRETPQEIRTPKEEKSSVEARDSSIVPPKDNYPVDMDISTREERSGVFSPSGESNDIAGGSINSERANDPSVRISTEGKDSGVFSPSGDNNRIVGGSMTIDQRPRYEKVDIVKGDGPIALQLSPDENLITKIQDTLRRLRLEGIDNIDPQKLSEELGSNMVLLTPGTRVEILDNKVSESALHEKFRETVKVRVIEGQHEGKIGWVSISTLGTERRLKSDE